MQNKKRISIIWRFGKRYWPVFIIGEICILVSYAISIVLPILFARLTDTVLGSIQHADLKNILIACIAAFTTATIFNFIYAFAWQYLNNHFVLDVKRTLFEKIIYADAEFLSKMNSGDMLFRIDGDCEQLIHVVQRNVFHFVNSIIMCLGIMIIVARINVLLSLILVCAAIFPIIVSRLCGRVLEKHTNETRNLVGDLSGWVFQILSGLREIKLMRAEGWATKKVLQPLNTMLRLKNQTSGLSWFSDLCYSGASLIATLTVFGLSVPLIKNEILTIGMFLAVVEYMALLQRKFNWILKIYEDWHARKVSIDRVGEILNLRSDRKSGEPIDDIDSVSFDSVSFEYDQGTPVLCDINLRINKGEHVAIVGKSGAGKSTIIALLLGLYETTAGSILINGTTMNRLDTTALRKHIGVVSQNVALFEGSIKFNLCLGKTISDNRIFEVLMAVDMLDVVRHLPNGIDTIISPTTNLSGGQKQRLMIARTILQNPDLIIFDEATSALDNETEKRIIDYIQSEFKETTTLVISHRLMPVANCDRIYVLDNHRIKCCGKHEDLINNSAEYKKMFGG